MKRLTVHLGLHKTGTTYLQTQVFPEIESLTLVRGFEPLRRLHGTAADLSLLVSDERIGGDPNIGRYFEQFCSAVNNLKRLYGDPRILMGVREHGPWLLSLYKQHLQEGADVSIQEYFSPDDSGLVTTEDLRIMPRLELLTANFSDVMIYSQECLQTDPAKFVRRFCAFAELPTVPDIRSGARRNVSVRSVRQVEWLRRLNRLDARLERSPLPFTLQSRFGRKSRLTPRTITQHRMRSTGPTFELPNSILTLIEQGLADDWRLASNFETTQVEVFEACAERTAQLPDTGE